MKVILCVTRDLVTGEAITSPQNFKNELEAERNWGIAIRSEFVKNPDNPVKDYQLYKIGDLDTETLVVSPDVKFLHNAVEFLGSVTPRVEVKNEDLETKAISEVDNGIHDNV